MSSRTVSIFTSCFSQLTLTQLQGSSGSTRVKEYLVAWRKNVFHYGRTIALVFNSPLQFLVGFCLEVTTEVPCSPKSDFPSSPVVEDLSKDHSVYLEERYGRNLPLAAAPFAKGLLRSRVAGVLKENSSGCQSELYIEQKDLPVGPSTRGVAEVAVDDVYLYATGMSAIWNAHNMALAVLPPAKSICFG
jgi:hypothetical protein